VTKVMCRIVVAISLLSGGLLNAADTPSPVDWKAELPAVRLAVRRTFPKEAAQAHYAASITRTADVTGTGQLVALVDLGSGGYTSDMTVVRMEGDEPVVARFEGRDGKISPMIFLSGISEGKGEAVEFRPVEHVVYSGHWVMNGAKLKQCRGEAYEWDASAKSFRFEKKLSKSMTREFCQKTATKLQPVILRGE
jgi:hypothetical protein